MLNTCVIGCPLVGEMGEKLGHHHQEGQQATKGEHHSKGPYRDLKRSHELSGSQVGDAPEGRMPGHQAKQGYCNHQRQNLCKTLSPGGKHIGQHAESNMVPPLGYGGQGEHRHSPQEHAAYFYRIRNSGFQRIPGNNIQCHDDRHGNDGNATQEM